MNKQEMINLFKSFTIAFEEMSEDQYKSLLNGKGRLKFVALESKEMKKTEKKETEKKFKPKLSDEELKKFTEQLQSCKTQEEARSLLQRKASTLVKGDLLEISEMLKIHANENDTRDVIEDKIVHFGIGIKLRSQAIESLSFEKSESSQETTFDSSITT